MTAPIVAFEGIDGSGKGTQSKLLADRLTEQGMAVKHLAFPRYAETRFGRAIGEFLNGRFGQLSEVHPYLVSVLYSGDRFESISVLEEARATADVVVLDRYTASNIAHQGARVDPAQRDDIVDWIEDIEHRVFGLPRADLTVLLDVSVETSQRLIRAKAPRDYTDKEADLQESNVAYMSAVREFYGELAVADAWCTIPCERDGALRSVEEIADEVAGRVHAALELGKAG